MIDKHDLSTLINKPPADLLPILASICKDICDLHTEVSLAESAEIQARVDGWAKSAENSVKGREWAATMQAAPAKQTFIDRKADLAIRTEEKWFILRLLDDYQSRL